MTGSNPEGAGRKEMAEAVLQASLIALLTGLINWGLEKAKERHAKRQAKPMEANP